MSTRTRFFDSCWLPTRAGTCHDAGFGKGASRVEVLHDRCAALDVSKRDVKVCVRTPGKRRNQRHAEVRTFATTTNELLKVRDWLVAEKVTLVVMEATGDYVRHEGA